MIIYHDPAGCGWLCPTICRTWLPRDRCALIAPVVPELSRGGWSSLPRCSLINRLSPHCRDNWAGPTLSHSSLWMIHCSASSMQRCAVLSDGASGHCGRKSTVCYMNALQSPESLQNSRGRNLIPWGTATSWPLIWFSVMWLGHPREQNNCWKKRQKSESLIVSLPETSQCNANDLYTASIGSL